MITVLGYVDSAGNQVTLDAGDDSGFTDLPDVKVSDRRSVYLIKRAGARPAWVDRAELERLTDNGRKQ